MEEAIVVDEQSTTENEYVAKPDLYDAYIKFCNKYNSNKKPIETFGKEIKRSRNDIGEGREGRGQRRNIWIGIKLKPEYIINKDKDQQTTLFCENEA